MTLRPVCYIAGPFRATPITDQWQQFANIRRAEAVALDVWTLGAAALCPHLNTIHFQGALPDDVWLEGDLALLARCDAVLMMPDWRRSMGATAERDFALAQGIPVFESVEALRLWMRDRRD